MDPWSRSLLNKLDNYLDNIDLSMKDLSKKGKDLDKMGYNTLGMGHILVDGHVVWKMEKVR